MMETGTGKTYTYTKTIFELNKHYGIFKFIMRVLSELLKNVRNLSVFIRFTCFFENIKSCVYLVVSVNIKDNTIKINNYGLYRKNYFNNFIYEIH
jgi:type III restriction enzyme